MGSKRIKSFFLALHLGILFQCVNSSSIFAYEIHLTYRDGNFQFNPTAYQLKTNNAIFTQWAYKFPYYSGTTPVNGGIPQNGDMAAHIAQFDHAVNYLIPDPNWSGYAVLDFEAWWGTYNLSAEIYQTKSKDKVRAAHPTWTEAQIEAQAIVEFEAAAKEFILAPIRRGKILRPNAKWGYYGAPAKVYYDSQAPDGIGYPEEIKRENEKMDWLWQESSALYPSIYQVYNSQNDEARFEWNETYISGVLDEAVRVAARGGGKPIYSYIYHRYHPSGRWAYQLCIPRDMEQQIRISQSKGLSGSILWTEPTPTTPTIATEELALKGYLDSTLSAIIDRYIPRTTFPITASAGVGGTITPNGISNIPQGGNQTYTITPNSGYKVSQVTVNNVSQGAITSYTFTNVQSAKTISATFAAQDTTPPSILGFSVSNVQSTSISLLLNMSEAAQIQVQYGLTASYGSQTNWTTTYSVSNVVPLATLSSGALYHFRVLMRDSAGNSATSADMTFQLGAVPTYAITASAGSGGTISPSGVTNVTQGGSQIYTITANAGYKVSDVKVNNVSQGAITSYTFSNVQAAQAINATFSILDTTPPTVTIQSPAANIIVSGIVNIQGTASDSQSALSQVEFFVDNVSVGVDATAPYAASWNTASATHGAHTIKMSARDALGNVGSTQISVSVDKQGPVVTNVTNSNVTPTGITLSINTDEPAQIQVQYGLTTAYGTQSSWTGTFNSATTITLTNLVVASVYNFKVTTYDQAGNYGSSNNMTFQLGSLPTYTITASAGAGGTISPSGVTNVTQGGSQIYTITANAGYKVSDVTVNNISQGAITSYTFTNVQAAQSIAASFVQLDTVAPTIVSMGPTNIQTTAVLLTINTNEAAQVQILYGLTPSYGEESPWTSAYNFTSRVMLQNLEGSAQYHYQVRVRDAAGNIGTSLNQTFNLSIPVTPPPIGAEPLYVITSEAEEGGTISPTGESAVEQGGDAFFEMRAQAGYRLMDVLVDGESVGAVSQYRFMNVRSNHRIVARFARELTPPAVPELEERSTRFMKFDPQLNLRTNREMTIRYELNADALVTIYVRNRKGEVIKSLHSGDKSRGEHAAIWDGRDENGEIVSAGMYMVSLNTDGSKPLFQKVILLK